MRAVDLTWAGGEHPFLLNIELLRALQDKCDAGPAHVLQRLASGQWRVDDVIQPIRLGLEGGGTSKQDALRLVRKFVEDQPLSLSVITARAVLAAALFGVDDDPVGEMDGEAETETPTLSETDGGGSPNSTKPADQSG